MLHGLVDDLHPEGVLCVRLKVVEGLVVGRVVLCVFWDPVLWRPVWLLCYLTGENDHSQLSCYLAGENDHSQLSCYLTGENDHSQLSCYLTGENDQSIVMLPDR